MNTCSTSTIFDPLSVSSPVLIVRELDRLNAGRRHEGRPRLWLSPLLLPLPCCGGPVRVSGVGGRHGAGTGRRFPVPVPVVRSRSRQIVVSDTRRRAQQVPTTHPRSAGRCARAGLRTRTGGRRSSPIVARARHRRLRRRIAGRRAVSVPRAAELLLSRVRRVRGVAVCRVRRVPGRAGFARGRVHHVLLREHSRPARVLMDHLRGGPLVLVTGRRVNGRASRGCGRIESRRELLGEGAAAGRGGGNSVHPVVVRRVAGARKNALLVLRGMTRQLRGMTRQERARAVASARAVAVAACAPARAALPLARATAAVCRSAAPAARRLAAVPARGLLSTPAVTVTSALAGAGSAAILAGTGARCAGGM